MASTCGFSVRKSFLPCSKKNGPSAVKMINNYGNLPPVLQTNRTRADIAPQLEGIIFSHQGNLCAAPSPPALNVALTALENALLKNALMAGSTTFFYPLEIIMSNLTQPAAVVHQPVAPANTVAPGDIEQVDDEAAAARLTAIRIRGQHAGLDSDEPA